MSNYYVPCFYRIDFVVIPSYIELPWLNLPKILFSFHRSLLSASFLKFVNHMHDGVHSNVFLYADNSNLIFKNKDAYKIAKKKTNE